VGKVIFWIVVFFLVLLALRLISVHQARRTARDADNEENAKEINRGGDRDDTPANDTMVRCANCGVYLPKADAVMSKTGMSCGNTRCERLKR
jgi:uncharacterized protein